jgi:hypothetical protein
MSQFRVQSQQEFGVVKRRPVPLPHLLITATTSGGAQTFYTVRAGAVMLEVKRLSVANITGSAATLTLHSVPAGGSIANGNAELVAYSVPANTAADLSDLIGGLYERGATLRTWAGTGSALVLHGWGDEIA